MTRGFHKKQSKRIPARLRYKVEKRVKDHHRKLKRQAKKNRDPNAKHKKPIAVIPGNVPFKDKIVQEAKEVKDREAERKKLLKSILRGDTAMNVVLKDRPVFKLNSKKKPIQVKRSAASTVLSPAVVATQKPADDDSMQCD